MADDSVLDRLWSPGAAILANAGLVVIGSILALSDVASSVVGVFVVAIGLLGVLVGRSSSH